jgi:hypothetical protein
MSFQIAIPTLSRSKILKEQTLSTLERFNIDKGLITIFVVEEELKAYKTEIGEDYNFVVGVKGIVQQREFIENYYPAGTFIVSLDDDLKDIDLDCYNSLSSFINYSFKECLERKSFIWGVYPVFNPFFRKSKEPLSTCLNFCIGAFYGFINRPNEPDLKIEFTNTTKEDVERTIRYFIKDGIVLRFNKIGFKTNIYGNGGLGKLKERMPNIILDTQKLADHFRQYGKIKIRKNGIWEFELKKIKAISNETFEVKVLPMVSKTEFDNVFQLLEKISIPFKTGRSSRFGFPKHRATIFGKTKGRFNGIIGLSVHSKKYPAIYEELLRIGKLICPFEFDSIFVNKNVVCPKHKDAKNNGESLLVSFGDYSGGNIVIDNINYDANCTPIIFNGAGLEHYNTDDLVGTKYSLIYFNSNFKKN